MGDPTRPSSVRVCQVPPSRHDTLRWTPTEEVGESAPHYMNQAREVSNGESALPQRPERRTPPDYFASHTTYPNCTSIVTQPRLVTRNIVFVVPVARPLGRITDG